MKYKIPEDIRSGMGSLRGRAEELCGLSNCRIPCKECLFDYDNWNDKREEQLNKHLGVF